MSISDTITWLIFILIFRYATDIKYTRMVLKTHLNILTNRLEIERKAQVVVILENPLEKLR